MYLFSYCRSGKEGEKTNKDLWRPYIPIGFQTILVKSVACGAQHSMAITDDGVRSGYPHVRSLFLKNSLHKHKHHS